MVVQQVGLIGVGTMGAPVVNHLLRGKYSVTVYDAERERGEKLLGQGARVARSPREVAAHSELVLIVVVDDAQVKEVCLGRDAVLDGCSPNSMVAICSTVLPQTCREVGEKAHMKGVHVLDTPMVRGVQAAIEGKLLLMVGGNPGILERCRPVFQTFASEIFHLGDLGAGQVGKMVNNLILWACLMASREGLLLAKNSGINVARLREALLHGSADNLALREWHLVAQQPKLWHQKDLHGVLEIAEASNTPVPISALVKELSKGFTPEEAVKLMLS